MKTCVQKMNLDVFLLRNVFQLYGYATQKLIALTLRTKKIVQVNFEIGCTNIVYLLFKLVLRNHYYCKYIHFNSREWRCHLILPCPIYDDGNNNDLTIDDLFLKTGLPDVASSNIGVTGKQVHQLVTFYCCVIVKRLEYWGKLI